MADLSAKQVRELLAAVQKNSTIEWKTNNLTWRLSDRGAAAVLLKMDELQGRLDTPGALIKKGGRIEQSVPPALPLPTIHAVHPTKLRAAERKWVRRELPNLLAALRKTVSEDDCGFIYPDTPEPDLLPRPNAIELWRLNEKQLLVSTLCSTSAYNPQDMGFWIIAERAPFNPILVTPNGHEFAKGVIQRESKGRGGGDCWSGESWVRNGDRFIHAENYTTGQCKGFLEGAWRLHTLNTRIIRP